MLKQWWLGLMILLLGVHGAKAQDGGSTLQSWADYPSSPFSISKQIEWPSYSITFGAINTYDTLDDPVPSCVPSHQYSIWHSFVAPQTGTITIQSIATNYDVLLAVYRDAPTAVNEIRCLNGRVGTADWEYGTFQVQTGKRYYVMIAAPGAGIGVDASSQVTIAYASNKFSDTPIVIPPSGSYSNIQTHIETTMPYEASTDGCPNFNYVVFYRFRPTTSGRYEFSTQDSSYDTIIRVASTSAIVCNDDISVNNRNSRLRLNLVAGQYYAIAVGQSVAAPVMQDSNMVLSLRVRKL